MNAPSATFRSFSTPWPVTQITFGSVGQKSACFTSAPKRIVATILAVRSVLHNTIVQSGAPPTTSTWLPSLENATDLISDDPSSA